MVTIYDIAKAAGCSAMTVSRVINHTGRISDKTRKRVQTIMQEMQYVPNSTARSLVLQQTKLLSLLITDITNPFYTTMARGAEDAARRLGYQLLFSNSDEDADKEKDNIHAVRGARVDGVIIAPVGDQSAGQLQQLQQHRIPFVLIDRDVPGIETDTVLGDSKEGARKLTEHLLELGHRRIAFLNGSLNTSTARQRLEGYKEALILAGIAYDEELVSEIGFKESNASEAMDKIAQLGTDRPTGIFAANNTIALAAVRSLRDRGFSIPGDFSVVCFDDMASDYVIDPFLTVAAQPSYDFGAIAVELLVARIAGEREDTRRIILPSKLIVRGSSVSI
ncbi:LacI family DNA-binding transcriptional regulator [Paenibacillus sp. GCM10023252]|uniref:LacI family DNA-binding transcriptional regulator n=1 Tax=Paenibacillus sp. GCM10023252 TaxID=3252649 RepID=UPI0036079B19